MQMILGNSDYTFVASTKKITLVAPFDTLDEERILRITNLTTRAIIYDSERRTHPISVASGAITHTYDATGMANDDKLQIIVDRYLHKSPTILNDWTAVAQNAIVASGVAELREKSKHIMYIQAAINTTTPHTGTRFIVETSSSESGNNWCPLTDFVALIGTATTSATENDLAVGGKSITSTSHGLTVEGILLFIEDGTLANSEIGRIAAIPDANTITLLDGVTNAHATGTNIFNIAMAMNVTLPSTAMRARLVVDNTYDEDGSTLDCRVDVVTAIEE